MVCTWYWMAKRVWGNAIKDDIYEPTFAWSRKSRGRCCGELKLWSRNNDLYFDWLVWASNELKLTNSETQKFSIPLDWCIPFISAPSTFSPVGLTIVKGRAHLNLHLQNEIVFLHDTFLALEKYHASHHLWENMSKKLTIPCHLYFIS